MKFTKEILNQRNFLGSSAHKNFVTNKIRSIYENGHRMTLVNRKIMRLKKEHDSYNRINKKNFCINDNRTNLNQSNDNYSKIDNKVSEQTFSLTELDRKEIPYNFTENNSDNASSKENLRIETIINHNDIKDTNDSNNNKTNDNQSFLSNLSDYETNTQLTQENLITKNKIEAMNKILPLGKNIVEDAIKYEIFTNSTPTAVEELKKDVPEIEGHLQFREWVDSIISQDKQEEVFKSQGILILKQRQDIFHKLNVDMHNYRKFHDREYEVDIEEVLAKDLFEKQRVVDNFVEENKENINNLIGYYNNRFKHLKYNKFNYLIYQNNYLDKMKTIKIKFLTNIASVSLMSTILYLVNPYLMFFLIPEYFAILFYSYILNNMVDQIILCENKQNVVIRTFNFLGFRKEFKPKVQHQILQFSYYEKLFNRILNLSDKGWFYTTRLLRRIYGNSKKNNEKNNFTKNSLNLNNDSNSQNSSKDSEKSPIQNSSLDDFKIFHVIRSNNKFFYIPADLSTQHPDTNEELILNIINRNQKFLEEYDYSSYEDRVSKLNDAIEEYKKEYAKKSHGWYVTEKEKLKEKYSNITGNRDFSDDKYELTLKTSDGIDGTFINNGYR